MKNTIRVLFILGTIIIFCLSAFLTFELSFYSKIQGDCIALDIEFEDGDAFASMLDWAEREDVNIVKLDESQDGYRAVHVSSKLLKTINSERITLLPFRAIPVYGLTEAEHLGYSSLYFVSLSSDKEVNDMEAALANKGIKIEKRMFCTPFSLLLSERWLDWGKVYSLAFLLLSMAVVSSITIFKYICEADKGIYKCQLIETLKEMIFNKKTLLEFSGVGVIVFFVILLTGGIRSATLAMAVYMVSGLMCLLCWLVTIVLFIGLIRLLRIANTRLRVNGKYICSIPAIILMIILCTVSISRAAFIAQRAWVGGKNLLLCRNYSNVYKVVMNNIGQDQSLEKENEIREFAEKAYRELTREKGGFFMDSNDVACNDLMGFDSEQDGLIHERCNTHITVSPNFYKINPIQALDGEPVESKIDYDENTINLAVPEKYMHLRDQFVEQFTDYLDFNRFLIGERVYSAASNEKWNPNKGPLSVNIIPVKNGQSYYTFDDSVRRNENNSIADAVAVIYTDNFHPSYILFTSSRALFFQYDEEQPVDDYLNEIAGIKGFIRADSVFKTAKKDFELDLLDFAVALLMLGINIGGYLEVSQLISEKKRNALFQLIPAASGLGICYLLSGFRVMRIMRFDVIKGIILMIILETIIFMLWGRNKLKQRT